MKRTVYAIIAAGLVLTSCGTTGNFIGAGLGTTASTMTPATTTTTTTTTTTSTGSMLGNLLTGLISRAVPLTAESLVGTWTYDSPECRFESENFLAQAGGEIAATTVETKMSESLARIGVTRGTCTFTFNRDNTCTVMIGDRPIIQNGSYTVNANTRQLNIRSGLGLVSLTGQVYVVGNTMTLLFDAQKLLGLVRNLGAVSSNASTAANTLSAILNEYQGMQLGMNLTK